MSEDQRDDGAEATAKQHPVQSYMYRGISAELVLHLSGGTAVHSNNRRTTMYEIHDLFNKCTYMYLLGAYMYFLGAFLSLRNSVLSGLVLLDVSFAALLS